MTDIPFVYVNYYNNSKAIQFFFLLSDGDSRSNGSQIGFKKIRICRSGDSSIQFYNTRIFVF